MTTPSSLCSAQRAVAFAGSNDILSKKVGVLLYRKRLLFSGEISESYPIAGVISVPRKLFSSTCTRVLPSA